MTLISTSSYFGSSWHRGRVRLLLLLKHARCVNSKCGFGSSIYALCVCVACTYVTVDLAGESSAAVAPTARSKARQAVDRRASKGRTIRHVLSLRASCETCGSDQLCDDRSIRYSVMPKLVNFMAPIPRYDQSFVADELFEGLFGASRENVE